jgi:FemAB-related protein (PEP-CTERM system-associated)
MGRTRGPVLNSVATAAIRSTAAPQIPRSAALAVSIARAPEDPEIEAFVAAHPLACAYHQPCFVRAIRRGAGLAVATFVARRGREVVGTLPLALTRSRLFGTYATSLPFFNYGGVLATEAGAARALVAAAWEWARGFGARHMILRHTGERPLDLPETHGKETLTLALPAGDEAALWKAIGSKTRNLVRKAQRERLAASVEGASGLGAFHAVYAHNMRDLGTPPLGCAFFRALFAEVGAAARVHIVRHGGRPAAAAVTIRFRDRVEVPWASCLERYNRYAANMLLYWELLRGATLAGARVFDFGRSTPGSGPHRFKLQWGAKPEPLPWYFVAPEGRAPTADLSPANPKFALAIRLWRKLPVGIARVLGSHLAPGLP